ncbi:hypothetical protein A9Q76_00780, partial [Arcobacter sp. 31_11_sub10_T18]
NGEDSPAPEDSTVDEEGLATAATQDDSYDGDVAGIALTAGGDLNISWGSDDNNSGTANRSVAFDAAQPGLSGLTSNGEDVVFSLSNDGTVLTAIADGVTVFTVSLSDLESGSYDFSLLDNLDHPTADTEDDINLTFNFTATDSDGDTAGSSFTITVDDDAPVIGEALSENDGNSILLGAKDGSADLGDWGVTPGALTGAVTMNGVTANIAFQDNDSNANSKLRIYNNNADHIGGGSLADNDGQGINNGETLTISFDQLMQQAEIGVDGLGNHFLPESSQQAHATWIAYKNGVEVASGDVKQSTDDNNATTNSFVVEVEFDKIEFTTISDATNSNYSIQYMNVDYIVDDTFDYVSIDSQGLESEVATVTIDMDTMGETASEETTSATYEAYAYNGDNFMTGNFNNPGNIKLNSVNETAIATEYGVGIQNNQNESETGIDDNESLLLKITETVKSATFNLNVPSNQSFNGGWVAFNSNGNAISTGTFASTGSLLLTIASIGEFEYIAFDAHTSNGNANDSGFYVEAVSYVNTSDESHDFSTPSTIAGETITEKNIESTINTGDGDDSITATKDIKNQATINTNEGDDTVTAKNLDSSSINTSEGNDTVTITHDMKNQSSINTGDDDDTVTISHNLDGGTIITGSGNDIVTVNNDMKNQATINTGEGNDTVTIGNNIDSASIDTGSGNDTVNIGNKLENQASIEMGDGFDILDLSRDADIDLTQISNRVKNAEVIDINDSSDQKVTIDFSDIVDLTDDDNELVFVGNNGDVIDFSDNSDWQLNGNETKKVDGVDGDFKEYVSTQAGVSVSIFIEDDIDVEDF